MYKSEIESLLTNNRVIICIGSGGVGKTTVSAALAVKAAQLGLRVLVMTIDPSMRLKVALGMSSADTQAVKVPNQNYLGVLSATLLNSEELFKSFIFSSSASSELAEKLLNNRLYQQLSTTLSGSQEFTALLQLAKVAEDKSYDLVILDTPPAKHAVDFLEAPEKILALFQDNIVRWFVGDENEVGLIRKLLSKGTQTLLRVLEKITGNMFMHELNDFFLSIRSLQVKISERSQAIQNLLKNERTQFLLITGFDEAKIKEADELKQYLQDKRYNLGALIINKAFPQWSEDNLLVSEKDLAKDYKIWRGHHAEKEKIYSNYAKSWKARVPVVRIPDLNKDIEGLKGLEGVADEIVKSFLAEKK